MDVVSLSHRYSERLMCLKTTWDGASTQKKAVIVAGITIAMLGSLLLSASPLGIMIKITLFSCAAAGVVGGVFVNSCNERVSQSLDFVPTCSNGSSSPVIPIPPKEKANETLKIAGKEGDSEKSPDSSQISQRAISSQKSSIVPFPQERQLRVEEMNIDECEKYREILKIIIQIGEEKQRIAHQNGVDFIDFYYCYTCWEDIKGHLHKLTPTSKIYFCKDTKGDVQGGMEILIESDEIYIAFLATHPRNIRSILNQDEPEAIRGVGSSLLQEAEELARSLKKKEVYLASYPNAVSFYLERGYKIVPRPNRKYEPSQMSKQIESSQETKAAS